jgi:hypothetical protein
LFFSLFVLRLYSFFDVQGAALPDASREACDMLVSSVDRLDEDERSKLNVFLEAVLAESRNARHSPRGFSGQLKLKMDISPFKRKESEVRLRIDL